MTRDNPWNHQGPLRWICHLVQTAWGHWWEFLCRLDHVRLGAPTRSAAPACSESGEAQGTQNGEQRTAPARTVSGEELRQTRQLLLEVTTALWRVRRRILPSDGTEPSEKLRRLQRYVDSAWDALGSAGVEVRDHTGEPYVPGMALKVIAFQPTPGATAEVIDETIRPSIYHRDTLVQRGEVIVAVPEKMNSEPRGSHDPLSTQGEGTSA